MIPLCWKCGDEDNRPNNHYEMAWPYQKGDADPILFIANGPDISRSLSASFKQTEPVGVIERPNGKGGRQTTRYLPSDRLSGKKFLEPLWPCHHLAGIQQVFGVECLFNGL